MPNEGTAVMTGAQQRAIAAHQPGQDVFKSILSEDINWKLSNSRGRGLVIFCFTIISIDRSRCLVCVRQLTH